MHAAPPLGSLQARLQHFASLLAIKDASLPTCRERVDQQDVRGSLLRVRVRVRVRVRARVRVRLRVRARVRVRVG